MLDCLASGQARHRQRYFVGTAATTCGTTWHAAGLIGQLRNSRQMTCWARGTVKGPRLLPRSRWRIVVEFGAPFLRHAGLDKILNEARPDVPSRCRRTREPIPRNLPPCKRALRSVVRFSSARRGQQEATFSDVSSLPARRGPEATPYVSRRIAQVHVLRGGLT